MSDAHIFERRSRAMVVLLCVITCGVLFKLYQLQVVRQDDLSALATNQSVRYMTIEQPRGRIVDRYGRVLATSIRSFDVGLRKKNKAEALSVVERLASYLEKDIDSLKKQLESSADFIWLGRRLSSKQYRMIKELLPVIETTPSWQRYYPYKSAAGALIGRLTLDETPLSGVERAYDERLKKSELKLPVLRNNRGERYFFGGRFSPELHQPVELQTSLDIDLQVYTHMVLAQTVEKYAAKSATAVVVDIASGELLALAQAPDINPHHRDEVGRIRALSDLYEPGSTFKVLSFATLIEQGRYQEHQIIDCEHGRYPIGRFTIRDSHKYDALTAAEVFMKSSNIGTVKMMQDIDESHFKNLIERFGMMGEIRLPFIEMAAGRFPKKKRWGEVRSATISYGHGLMVTPLHLARMAAIIGNQGRDVDIKMLHDEQADTRPVDAKSQQVISAETSATLLKLMESVVSPEGTGPAAKIDGVRVAGKTGTAEKVDPSTRQYSSKLNVASFVGVVPADAPEYAILVLVDEPEHGRFGGTVAAPAFQHIARFALAKERLARDTDQKTANHMLSNDQTCRSEQLVVDGVSIDPCLKSLRENIRSIVHAGLRPVVHGVGPLRLGLLSQGEESYHLYLGETL